MAVDYLPSRLPCRLSGSQRPVQRPRSGEAGRLISGRSLQDEIPRMEGWSIYCALGPFALTWKFGHKPQWLLNDLAESIPPPNEGAGPVAHPKAENGEAV